MRSAELLGAFEFGPTRTLQQNVEFGVIQIVDIALRAISPAVNDPSTAISCIDPLSRFLIRGLGRAPPASVCSIHRMCRGCLPWISVDGMFDTAFEQVRHYAANDAAVSLGEAEAARLQQCLTTIEPTSLPHSATQAGLESLIDTRVLALPRGHTKQIIEELLRIGTRIWRNLRFF